VSLSLMKYVRGISKEINVGMSNIIKE